MQARGLNFGATVPYFQGNSEGVLQVQAIPAAMESPAWRERSDAQESS